ncbi:probable protein phosphatase 2C 47 [Tanacetum coccineum]|uniref:Probable protein phosphatase 2C 47 n=1 Tax=Tanacetum coccineum TaxID=301880 RepID=A0ABQ5HLS3_9ASTR
MMLLLQRYIVHMESLLEEAYLPTVRNSNIIRHIVAPRYSKQIVQPWVHTKKKEQEMMKILISEIIRDIQSFPLGNFYKEDGTPNISVIKWLFKRIDLDKDNTMGKMDRWWAWTKAIMLLMLRIAMLALLAEPLIKDAASYVKDHAMRLFFENSDIPKATTLDGPVDELFVKELQDCHCKTFLQADQNLKEEYNISDYFGSTTLTVLVLEAFINIKRIGDYHVVISRKGVAKKMSNDHIPSNLLRIKEESGGTRRSL